MVSFLPTSSSSTTVWSVRRSLSTATPCASLLNGSTIIYRRDRPECSFVVSTHLPYRNHVFYSTIHQACSLPIPANAVQDLNIEQPPWSSAATVSPHRNRTWIVAPVIVGLVLFVYCAWIYYLRPWLRERKQHQAVQGRDVRPQRKVVTLARDRVTNGTNVRYQETNRVYDYRRQEWTSVRTGDARVDNNENRDLPAQGPRRTLQINNPATAEVRFQSPPDHRRLNNHFPADRPPIYPPPLNSSPIHPPLVRPPPIHTPPVRSGTARITPSHQSLLRHHSTRSSPVKDSP